MSRRMAASSSCRTRSQGARAPPAPSLPHLASLCSDRFSLAIVLNLVLLSFPSSHWSPSCSVLFTPINPRSSLTSLPRARSASQQERGDGLVRRSLVSEEAEGKRKRDRCQPRGSETKEGKKKGEVCDLQVVVLRLLLLILERVHFVDSGTEEKRSGRVKEDFEQTKRSGGNDNEGDTGERGRYSPEVRRISSEGDLERGKELVHSTEESFGAGKKNETEGRTKGSARIA